MANKRRNRRRNDRLSMAAGYTRSRQLAALDDGHTLVEVPPCDWLLEGRLMHTCLVDDRMHPEYVRLLSLRDDQGLPVATVDVDERGFVREACARFNRPLTDQLHATLERAFRKAGLPPFWFRKLGETDLLPGTGPTSGHLRAAIAVLRDLGVQPDDPTLAELLTLAGGPT